MTIYISGAITNDENYLDKFADWEQFVKTRYECDIINPATVSCGLPNSWAHEQYMRHLLPFINECDAVFFLPDWRESCGACQEMGYAIALGKQILFAD